VVTQGEKSGKYLRPAGLLGCAEAERAEAGALLRKGVPR
jgi:hypothetical protein